MTSKLRVKAGAVEFEYEGETEFGITEIKELFSHIEAMSRAPGAAEDTDGQGLSNDTAGVVVGKVTNPAQKLHVNSIASNLKVSGGSELATAAAASLQIFDGKDTFTRAELLATMKKATLHYKESMSSNLTKILGVLVGKKFNQISDGVYSLTAEAFAELESQLA